jgi:hypothetical protein
MSLAVVLDLEYHREKLTTLQSQSCNVNDDLWPSLEDDEQDANRARHSVQLELLVELTGIGDLVGRAGEGDDV